MTIGSKKFSWRALLFFVGITLAAGALGALLGGDFSVVREWNAPPLAPPAWVFFPVWTILYTAMGVSAYLVWQTGDIDRIQSIAVYFLQLAVNVLWPLFFFRLQWRLFSFFWILLLIALVAYTIKRFSAHSTVAAWLLLPYFVWLLFASYLNLGYYVLNR